MSVISPDTSIKLSQKELALKQREIFNTVGKTNKPGAKIKTVIGVDMLSEGWDAKNVSHILGLRAFTSQLLCEQVIGRGLRRISYDIDPETNAPFPPKCTPLLWLLSLPPFAPYA